jgi:hypothetical protein
MDKFLLVLFLIIKIIVIVVAPILFFIFKNKEIKKQYKYIEIIALVLIVVLYLVGFPYVVDSNITNMIRLNMLEESVDSNDSDLANSISISNSITKLEADTSYKTHRNEDIYYYNGFDMPLAAKKIECEDGYDYYKYYSDMITSTSMLLSSYFKKSIDPLEILGKVEERNIIVCGEPINKDKFFAMISEEYKINFLIIPADQLKNYILNGKPILLETIGNGSLSCYQSYYLIYNINNSGDYLLLDPNNKSYKYICPDGTKGFGNILKPNYNESTFDSSSIISDTNRLIVIGGTR